MSATPPRASKCRALHERTPSEQNRLQVRLVPYSPPRLSFDGSLPTLSRSASAVDCSAYISHPSSPLSPSGGKTVRKGKGISSLSRPSTSSEFNSGSATRSSLSPSESLAQQSPEPTSFGLYSAKRVSLLPQTSSAAYSSKSALRPSTDPSRARAPSTSAALADDRRGSTLAPLHEESPSQAPTLTSGRSNSGSHSSWNHRFVGGLRKGYRRASGVSQTASASLVRLPASNPRLLSRLRRAPPTSHPVKRAPRARDSFRSAASGSTQSERSNYKIHASSSPAPGAAADSIDESFSSDFEGASLNSSHANVVILGGTSSGPSADEVQPSESEVNHHISCDGSTPRPQSRLEFSRESLLVPPLQPLQKGPKVQSGVQKSCSRRSSHARSFSSVSSLVVEETFASLLASAAPVHMAGEASVCSSSYRPANSGSRVARWVLSRSPQWNNALSTVTADSEMVRNGQSPIISTMSSSSSRGSQGHVVKTYAVGDSTACPLPVHGRPSTREQHRSTIRLIRNQDEHGDGLADLEGLHHHPSRSRMHSSISSYPSDRNLRSSRSSRSSSLSRSSVPAWARLYYGSGERRWLAAKLSTETMLSDFTGDSRGTTFPSRSPSADQFPAVIQSSRRRPREPASPARRSVTVSDSGHTDMASYPITPLISRPRTQPSSIWSPHLSRDRRTIAYGIWDPPSTVWSTNRVWMSPQNTQPILFVVGFVFPFAWAVASFLPLPSTSGPEMAQVNPSSSNSDPQLEASFTMDMLDMRLYNHARWWRTLNRAMAIVGIFVIGAIVALIVFGVRQQWRS